MHIVKPLLISKASSVYNLFQSVHSLFFPHFCYCGYWKGSVFANLYCLNFICLASPSIFSVVYNKETCVDEEMLLLSETESEIEE